jgi:transcriptional regulator with XRE-family HTH domain
LARPRSAYSSATSAPSSAAFCWQANPLGKRLGVTQPRVAALESGERNPDYETIINAVDKLQVEFAMDFSPSRKPPKLLTKTARAAGSTVTYRDVALTVTSR